MISNRIFDKFLSGSEWLIEEKGWYKNLQQVREAHFTLGNGIIGSRGILEDLPYDTNAGTFVAGIFDSFGAQIPELVNLPNPIVLRLDISGEKLDPSAMDVIEHYRALDMKKGLLVRRTLYETAHKERVEYQSYRFISQYQQYVGAMVVSVRPLDRATTFNVNSMIDTSVCNRGMLTEGRKRHFEVVSVSSERGINYTEVKTFEHQHAVGYATCNEVIKNGKKKVELDRTFKVRLKKGESAVFIRYFTIVPSFYVGSSHVKRIALKQLRRARILGVNRLFEANEMAWAKRWDVADIIMEGSKLRQKAVRFNLYHLLISGNEDNRVSIGARTLSGEGYRGHIFWDSETFILPFFIFTHPRIAKSMLMYRWQRLECARKIAVSKNYKGALFPWESAGSGAEATPSWFKDLSGELLKIETLEEEHHISADIAYAVNQYVCATGDERFMINYGLEILIETARFWITRFKYNKKMKRFETHRIMGPDEFHKSVKNNAYTNELARFNIKTAEKWCRWVQGKHPEKWGRLKKRLGLTKQEIKKCNRVADKIYVPYSKKKKLIEPFEDYFKLKEVKITELDQNFMPLVPHEARPPEDGETKLIKQADVVMLLYMLPEKYSADETERNYDYYEKRTLHKSSLSPSIHSAVAARLGRLDKALHHLTIAINSDLLDIHGNANEGFHGASGGGVWQAMVMGFGGLGLKGDCPVLNPLLPPMWKSLSFKVVLHGALIEVKVLKDTVELRRASVGRVKKFKMEVAGVQYDLHLRKVKVVPYNNKALPAYEKVAACKMSKM